MTSAPYRLPVTVAHAKLLQDIKAQFGFDRFGSKDAAQILGRGRGLLRGYLCALVKAGLVDRIKDGIFAVRRHPVEEIENSPAPISVFKPASVTPPVDPVEATILTLKVKKVEVMRDGDLFVIDGQRRVSCEILLLIAERRRLPRSPPVDLRSAQIAELFADLPEPSVARRMGAR